MIKQVIDQLVTALRDNTIGIQSEMNTVFGDESVVTPTLPDSHIYGFDKAVDPKFLNPPALVLSPLSSTTGTIRSQGKRDSEHAILFEYVSEKPDEDQWRTDAVLVAQALMRFLDQFNANQTNYVGTSGVIQALGWTTNYAVLWNVTGTEQGGFQLEANIEARDTFS